MVHHPENNLLIYHGCFRLALGPSQTSGTSSLRGQWHILQNTLLLPAFCIWDTLHIITGGRQSNSLWGFESSHAVSLSDFCWGCFMWRPRTQERVTHTKNNTRDVMSELSFHVVFFTSQQLKAWRTQMSLKRRKFCQTGSASLFRKAGVTPR